MAGIGHNKPPVQGGVAADQLKSIVQRVEKMEEEKAAVAADIKEVYAEAKSNGFDTKAIREIIKLRKIDPSDRDEQELILDTYKRALGMVAELLE